MPIEKHHKPYIQGFTLAEVLITITIIGIISALTIPGLITSIQDQQYIVTLKKNYSVLSAATKTLQENYGTIDVTSTASFKNEYKKVLTNLKSIDTVDDSIYPHILSFYKGNLGAVNGGTLAGLILSDGTILIFFNESNNCNVTYGSISTVCGAIGLDVNGNKSPNMVGKDYFEYVLYKQNGVYKLIPEGSQTGASCVSGSATWSTSLGCTQNVILGTQLP